MLNPKRKKTKKDKEKEKPAGPGPTPTTAASSPQPATASASSLTPSTNTTTTPSTSPPTKLLAPTISSANKLTTKSTTAKTSVTSQKNKSSPTDAKSKFNSSSKSSGSRPKSPVTPENKNGIGAHASGKETPNKNQSTNAAVANVNGKRDETMQLAETKEVKNADHVDTTVVPSVSAEISTPEGESAKEDKIKESIVNKIIENVQSEEEESSSTEIWCDAKEGVGSEDSSSLRAVSALSTLSTEDSSITSDIHHNEQEKKVLEKIPEPTENETQFVDQEPAVPVKVASENNDSSPVISPDKSVSPEQPVPSFPNLDQEQNIASESENEPAAVIQNVPTPTSPTTTAVSPKQRLTDLNISPEQAGTEPNNARPSVTDKAFKETDLDSSTEFSDSTHTTSSKHTSPRRPSLIRGISLVEEPSSQDHSIMDYLVDVQNGAEARLAARRQARAEAREIRMRELEKQQKESDDNADKQYDMYSSDVVNRAAFRVAVGNHRSQAHSVGSAASYHSSRRSSEDSSEDGMVSLRDMRHELKELEDKFRKSMVQNAQLDNEKAALTYQVELLKDKIEDIEENMAQLQREHKEKCREYENLKRISAQLKIDLECCKAQLQEKDDLIKDYGLVVVESEVEVDIGNGERETRIKRNLVTQKSADVLSTLGTGSLDVRLKKVIEENNDLQDEIRRLKLDLEEERNHSRGGYSSHNSVNNSHGQNGPEEDFEAQREASKIVAEYKFKVQKYEQEIATLQANVARLDGQVTRFKTASEEAESREDDLKVEKRKLQRELREAQSRLDELETTNSHLQKRLDKLKTAKSTLLKEL